MSNTRQISQPLHTFMLVTGLGLAALATLLDSSCRLLANVCILLAIAAACLTIIPTQEDRDLTDKTNRVCLGVLALTLLLGLIPCGLYGVARLRGKLPSEQAWHAFNAHAGPWKYEWQAFWVGSPAAALFFLAVITFGAGSLIAIYQPQSLRTIIKLFALFGLQVGLVILVFGRIYWVID